MNEGHQVLVFNMSEHPCRGVGSQRKASRDWACRRQRRPDVCVAQGVGLFFPLSH